MIDDTLTSSDPLPQASLVSPEDTGYAMGQSRGRDYPYLTSDEQNRQARDDMRSEGLSYTTKQWQYINGWLRGYTEISTGGEPVTVKEIPA